MRGRRSRLRVLVVLPYAPASFMQTDLAILQDHFDLDVLVHTEGLSALGRAVVGRLARRRPDVVLMWFVVPSYAFAVTLLARRAGAAVAFITGGYDVVGMPEIGYGAMRRPIFRAALRATLAVADLTLPFSRSAAHQVLQYASPRRWRVVYPGVDTAFFSPPARGERAQLAVTVSPVNAISILQKGLATFVQAAEHAPSIRFVLVGCLLDASAARLRATAPSNVEFIDRFLAAEDLRDLFRRTSCYVQASIHEGFGLAVAEAMACGAVPVVTDVYSLPEVTGGLGEHVRVNDPVAVAAAAEKSLAATPRQRGEFRRRVVDLFPVERRQRDLIAALHSVALSEADQHRRER